MDSDDLALVVERLWSRYLHRGGLVGGVKGYECKARGKNFLPFWGRIYIHYNIMFLGKLMYIMVSFFVLMSHWGCLFNEVFFFLREEGKNNCFSLVSHPATDCGWRLDSKTAPNMRVSSQYRKYLHQKSLWRYKKLCPF